ncbi:9328_t:CDS:2 [Acaulospora morrowiae]|uniref:9328_t:CDS:1 n=1 Tax=Acaulospora morrowiae TaxID=94023 RepID=A0A9N9HIA6_9GLOM|nr:9328_t:CDS:2 [Acaulospora morrowiae]
MAQIPLSSTYQGHHGSHMTIIPVDIFIEICSHLHPLDLFTLIEVCKQFRYWLNSASPGTQDIWRTSRLKFLPYLQLKPFADMDEQSYTRLGLIEKGCQFCGTRKEYCKVYWVFRVRCCKKCFNRKVVSNRDLPSGALLLVDTSNCLPYLRKGPEYDSPKMFWFRDVRAICKEFKSLTREDAAIWYRKKRSEAHKIMEDTRKRRKDECYWLISRRKQDKKEFEKIIHELRDMQRDDGESKYVVRWIWELKSCTKAFELSREPYIEKDWKILKRAMMTEYEELMKQQRRKQICTCILSLLTADNTARTYPTGITDYQVSVSDPLLECLRWCPSYQDPPFINNDPRNPWSTQYLLLDLIPQLRKEAIELHKLPGPIRPGSITTVLGALNHGCSQCEVYRCRLCKGRGGKHYNYQGVCCHLGSYHKVSKVMVEEMIVVDRERVIECIPKIFPFDGSTSEYYQGFRHWHGSWS